MVLTKLDDIKVCCFRYIADRHPSIIGLIDALRSFKGEAYRLKISNLRAVYARGNEDEYSAQKSHLPSITFCGQFYGGHAVSSLRSYNKIMIIDIDDLDKKEFDRVWNCLMTDSYVFSFWKSPSGMGIKGLSKLEYSAEFPLEESFLYHKTAFKLLRNYFYKKYTINLDISGSDVSRLCFVSFDPDLVVKDHFLPFKVDCSLARGKSPFAGTGIKIKAVKESDLSDVENLTYHKRHLNGRGKNKREDRNTIESIIRFLTKKHLSITKSYDDWYHMAFAIANSFTCDIGEKYFLKLSQLDGAGYDEIGSKRLLVGCYDNSRGNIGLGTLIKKAQEKGYILRGGSRGA